MQRPRPCLRGVCDLDEGSVSLVGEALYDDATSQLHLRLAHEGLLHEASWRWRLETGEVVGVERDGVEARVPLSRPPTGPIVLEPRSLPLRWLLRYCLGWTFQLTFAAPGG